MFHAKTKKLLTVLLVVCLWALSLAVVAWAEEPIRLIVNGVEIQSDVPPQVINGRTMIPARALAEALGAKVEWDAAQRAVIVTALSAGGDPAVLPSSSESASTPVPDTTSPVTGPFTGTWDTDWGTMRLLQVGNQVHGTYEYNQGRIVGTVSGDTMVGTWSEYPTYSPPNDAGDLRLTLTLDSDVFTAKWRYGSEGGWSEWDGIRQ
ncbi:MAG: copper amine oxidase N-terminal domain-containing protein [Firmicutes bacterium]|nr:copper amine oxidase N-terminal domain-containing protein [Bacillota bacterium]